MYYKDYPTSSKTFVVVHNTGYGVMESPYIEKEVVFESDSMVEAKIEAERLTVLNNDPDCGSWQNNTYWVNTNTSTEVGKVLEKKFIQALEGMISKGLENGSIKEEKVGDMKFYMEEDLEESASSDTKSSPLTSVKCVVFDITEAVDNKPLQP